MTATSSVITLANRALARAGARTTITSLDDPSKEAANCKLFYNPVRQMLLRAAPWNFARRQVSLNLLGSYVDNTSLFPWSYKYEIPGDSIKIRFLAWPMPAETQPLVLTGAPVNAWYMPTRRNRFIVANDEAEGETALIILTNVQNAIAIYTGDVTNVALFDPGFERALVASLARELVMPLAGNIGLVSALENEAMIAVNEARASDGNEGLMTTDHTPDWIQGRGIIPGYELPGTDIGMWYSGWENTSWGM